MEEKKTDRYIDCRREIFGSEVENIILDKDNIIFIGAMFFSVAKQRLICSMLDLPTNYIKGIEFVKIKNKTNNWFEKIFSRKVEKIRIYY